MLRPDESRAIDGLVDWTMLEMNKAIEEMSVAKMPLPDMKLTTLMMMVMQLEHWSQTLSFYTMSIARQCSGGERQW